MKKILVEHEVPYDKGHERECVEFVKGDLAAGVSGALLPCSYLSYSRRRLWSSDGQSIILECPYCNLFEGWLQQGQYYEKREECLELCGINSEEQNDGKEAKS